MQNDLLDFFGDTKNKLTSFVHIRVQQRTQRQYITTIQNLPTLIDLKKLLKILKKKFCCNGTIEENAIILQGDQRTNVANYLLNEKLCTRSEIKVHGY